MKKNLYVPVTVRALIIGDPPDYDAFADISDEFSRLPFGVLGEYVPSQTATHRDMERGIHLHWSLPDALTRGEMDESADNINYPAIPNRWLVTRLWSEDGGQVQSVSFYIESDAVSRTRGKKIGNLGSPAVPEMYGNTFIYLGRGFRCGDTAEPCEYLPHSLTAVLPANPFYTAFYPECRNVLGFYDDMTDRGGNFIQNAKVTYSVTGWYGNYRDSPVTILAEKYSYAEILDELGWKLVGGSDKTDVPEYVFFHSMICAIDWNGPKARYKLNIPITERLSVAFGNNSNEALASVLAGFVEKENPGGASTEYQRRRQTVTTEMMINHLLSGKPGELLAQDGAARSEEALFESRFISESLVKLYSLKWKGSETGGAGTPSVAPEPSPELDDYLNNLNKAQLEQAEMKLEIEAVQENLFDEWFAWKRQAQTDEEFDLKLNNLSNEIKVKKENLAAKKAENPLAALKKSAEKENFEVTEGDSGRYWAPSHPVLLISKVSVNNAFGDDGQYSDESRLHVRGGLISRFSIKSDVTGTGADYVLEDVVIPDIQAQNYLPGHVIEVAVALIKEAALLSHSFAPVYAKKILNGQNRESERRLTLNIIRLQSMFITLSAKDGDSGLLENAADYGFNGPLPEKTAVEYHTQPWYPLYMDWKAEYYPDPNVINTHPDINGWRRKGLDMCYKHQEDSSGIKLVNAVSVSGRTVLTSGAGQSLSSRLRELGGNIPNAGLISVLSQAMPELHEQLMMRSVQLMPAAYENNAKYKTRLESALEGYEPEFPLFNTLFSPVRAGFLKIGSVALIDSFGQYMESSVPFLNAAESVRRGDEVSVTEIMLPPRLLQPSRLNFSFAGGEKSAVCAWLLPNYFDNNITFYSAAGKNIGSLQLIRQNGGNALKFKLPPRSGSKTEENLDGLDMDPDLRGFIKGLLEQRSPSEAFEALMASVSQSVTQTNPMTSVQFNSLSFFLGRPIVLVRASLSLSTLGPAKKYRAFCGAAPPYPRVDISKLKLSVRLGYRHRHNDGLFGFFTGNDFGAIRFTGYCEKADSNIDYITRGRNTDFVTITPNSSPLKLVLLADPLGDIHASSGILPVKAIRMNPAYVQQAMRALYHFIFVAPVIQDTQSLSLPVFPVEGKEWAWAGFDKNRNFSDDTEPLKSGFEAMFHDTPPVLREGWLMLKNGVPNTKLM